jgi:hypothetical protein
VIAATKSARSSQSQNYTALASCGPAAAPSHGFAIILTDTGDRGRVQIAVSPAFASLTEYRARPSVREQSKEQKTAEFEVESFRESLGTP